VENVGKIVDGHLPDHHFGLAGPGFGGFVHGAPRSGELGVSNMFLV
jgi:hypothetical protein